MNMSSVPPAEGLPAATVGAILDDWYAGTVTEEATSASPYLTLWFTDSLDGPGASWDTTL